LRIRSVEEPLIRDRCRAVMEELGIEGISAKNAYSLSAGRAHLVSIARGFVLDPEIIFLDEPFIYLDSEKRSLLAKALQRRRAIGRGVMVSHDLEIARAVGFDRFIEMEDLYKVAETAVDRHSGYIIFYEYRGWCVY
jgi:ABC-type multidrug transport system ATPase subunit